MQLVIAPGGSVRCLYGEAVDLHALGRLSITRGSHVEPTEEGRWVADLSPVNGPALGPFSCRSEALAAEAEWLERHIVLAASVDAPETPHGLPASVPRPDPVS